MGVLDEAIREHLELKRAHGASDAELRRQEAEALGPVRREPGPPPDGEDDRSATAEATDGETPPADEPERPVEAERPAGASAAIEESGPDEVTADEALDVEGDRPAEAAEPPPTDPPRVFDVEELGPPDEAIGARGGTVEPASEELKSLEEELDEAVLDAEEEAEEELAEELAGGNGPPEGRPELDDSVETEAPPHSAESEIPPDSAESQAPGDSLVSEAPPDSAESEAPPHDVTSEDTIYLPPPPAAAGAPEAETDEYAVQEDLLEAEVAAAAEPGVPAEPSAEPELLEDEPPETPVEPTAEPELLEEEPPETPVEPAAEPELVEEEPLGEEALLEEELVLEDELAVEEPGPPDQRVPADGDLNVGNDLQAPEGGPPSGDAYASEPQGGTPDEHGRDEDVLEETPDFLEETPEDERRWREQEPPDDFDLDR